MAEEFESIPGSPEQVEVFLDLQRMLVKLYNMWPNDSAIAVYAAAAGSIIALIEHQYKVHVEACPHCQEEKLDPTIDLVSTARHNFDFYYQRGVDQSTVDSEAAKSLVADFFKGKEH